MPTTYLKSLRSSLSNIERKQLTAEFVGEFQQLKTKNEQLQEELSVQTRKRQEVVTLEHVNSIFATLTTRIEQAVAKQEQQIKALTMRVEEQEAEVPH